MSELFSGVAVALVTVFDDQGDIDPGSTAVLASDLVARGIRAVLVCGTTGEAATLGDGERTALIEAVRAALPGAIPVIAGTGAPSLWQAERLTTDAVRAGADAVLAWSPAGCRELGGYYAALASAAGGRPVLAYHLPSVSSPGVPVAALPALPVAGIKYSIGSPDRLLDELAHYRGRHLRRVVGAARPGRADGRRRGDPGSCQRRARGLLYRAFAGDAVVQRDTGRQAPGGA